MSTIDQDPTDWREPRLLTPQEQDIAIGGKLLVKVRLERLWEIRERADSIISQLNISPLAHWQAVKIKQAINEVIKEAIDVAERAGK